MPTVPLRLPENYRTMSTDDLLELKVRMESRQADITMQLGSAKDKAAAAGEYANPAWYRNASRAKAAYGHDIQRIQNILKQRKERQNGNSSLENLFVTIAKRRLDETVFKDIMAEAREEMTA